MNRKSLEPYAGWFSIIAFVIAIYAAGQALTFAWLSAFPDRAPQLPSLTFKFWTYATLSAFAAVLGVALAIVWLKKSER